MRLVDCAVGTKVIYYPSGREDPGFRGVVRESPWQLGDGTWVTHVHRMEPLYRDGKTSTVYAAVVEYLDLDMATTP
jgi:hypothetical protein